MPLLSRWHPFEHVVNMMHCIGWLYFHVVFSHATYMKIPVPPYVEIRAACIYIFDSYLFATNKCGACLCGGGGNAHHGSFLLYSTCWQLHLVSYCKSTMSHTITNLSVMSRHVILVNAQYSFAMGSTRLHLCHMYSMAAYMERHG